MSTWIVTSRKSPIRRIGMRSTGQTSLRSRHRDPPDRPPGPLQGEGEGIGQRGLGRDVAEVDAEVDDRLGDLGADAADDALGPHQPGRGHRLQQVLGRQRVDRRHARDVDDGDARTGLDDLSAAVSP